MEPPYQIILDFWEGNPDINIPLLKANGVVGLIARLNDMHGGHHMDKMFAENWAKTQEFPISALYFVYNPWVDAVQNYMWYQDHMPADYGNRRVFIDVEVRYSGYSPIIYGREVAKFMAMVRKDRPATIYSGGGYREILTPWPKDEEYWWAAYSTTLTLQKTWDKYKEVLARIEFGEFVKLSPGPVRLWQATGDGVKLPGFGNHAVDINVFPGTLEEAREWFNSTNQGEIPVTEEKAPVGLYTTTTGWSSNPEFAFVMAEVHQPGVFEPYSTLKPIQEEAAKARVPFLLHWTFMPEWYSEKQLGEQNWPTPENDQQFQAFLSVLKVRQYQGVVVDLMTYKTASGKPEHPNFLSFAGRTFCERVDGWLRANRPSVPLIIAGSNSIMSVFSPNMKNWFHIWENMAVEATPIKDSRPLPGAKPAYLGNSFECPFWRYYEFPGDDPRALILFRGENGYLPTRKSLNKWFNFEPGTVPPVVEPPSDPRDDEIDEFLDALDEFSDDLEAFAAGLDEMSVSLNKLTTAIQKMTAELDED